MANHRAVHVESAGQPLTLVSVETLSPPPGHVRIAVAACGVCGTDHAFVNGVFPGLNWPVTPGHEIAGTVAELGDGVEGFAEGDRVAVGWFGGNCNRCIPPDALRISPLDLINSGLSVTGHPSGTARDVEETMTFAVQSGVRAVIEEKPLAEAAAAYAAMDSGRARYRMVLTI